MKSLVAVLMTLLLAGCSSGTEESQVGQTDVTETEENDVEDNNSNLIDFDSVTEDFWIQYNGGESKDEKMMYTDKISYNSSNEYELNIDGYVSYYNGDEFLETILHIEDKPQTIKTNTDANNIVISFKKSFKDASLIQK